MKRLVAASGMALLALGMILSPGKALAEDDEESREDEMFGGTDAVDQDKPADQDQAGKEGAAKNEDDEENREDDMFGADSDQAPLPDRSDGPGTAERLADALREIDDPLSIGGDLYLRFHYNILDEGPIEDHGLTNPNLLHLYMDVRPNDRVRGFVRGRLKFDPTVEDGDTNAFGQELTQLDVFLDQIWLKFDIYRAVYVTVGRQPVRWGSGRFWNPTDFLNQQRRDPLAIFDERLGVTLAKVHIPVESLGWNFYLAAKFDGASSADQVCGAARAEFLIAQTELAASAAIRKDQPLRLGLDVSSALGPLDVRVEGAVIHGDEQTYWRGTLDLDSFTLPEGYSREDDWIPQVSAGAEVSILYTEQDSLILGVEYFYNNAGITNAKLYPWLAVEGQYTPFYLGQHYVSGYLVFMGPGTWDDTSISLAGIANLTDGTGLVRLDYQVLLLTYLQVSAFAAVFTGDEGEFRFGMDIPPTPGVPGLEEGLKIVPQRVQLGLWLLIKV